MNKTQHAVNTFNIPLHLVLFLATALSLIQFFSGRSLWLDEAMLALNILEKSPQQLMRPLDHQQVAPPLFLLLEKGASNIPCQKDYTLRLVPLLSFWTVLFFFRKLSHNVIQLPSARFASISLIALSSVFLYYSNEIKQYMTDAAVTCLLYYLYLQPRQRAFKYFGTLIIAGGLAIFLSNAAIILLFSMGIAMLLEQKKRMNGKWVVLAGVVWMGLFLVNYILFIKGHPSKDFMLTYWEKQHAFMPLNPFSEEFIRFAGKQYANFAGMFLSKLPWMSGTLLPTLLIFGILQLAKRYKKSPFLLLLLLPLPVHLSISALKLYPFDARLYLYLLPVFALIMGLGWEKIVSHFPSQHIYKLEKGILILPFFLLAGTFLNGFPLQRQEHKDNLTYYNRHSKPGQGLFISAGSRYVAEYYSRTHFIEVKGPLVLSKMKKTDSREMKMKEILSLQGQQWLLFTPNYRDPVDYFLQTLDSLHIPCLESHIAEYSSLFLYDFGNGQEK